MARKLVTFGTEGTVFAADAAPRPTPAAMPRKPAGGPPVLVMEGLRKAGRKDGPHLLSWMELEVARGEMLSLLGPAGAGKSTAIDLVAGFLQPDAGRLLMGGEKLERLPPHRRDIGLVSSLPDLFPDLTLLGNVTLPLEARGVARAEREERAAAMLERWGVPASLGHEKPGTLPLARQSRVAFARALVHNPALLLLDDPLRGLDGEERAALAADLHRLRRELGLTILHATRDPSLALTLSDRVAVLDGGRMRQIGTPRDLYETPADPVVAALTGPCNRLPGTVLTIMDGTCRIRLDCGVEVLGLPVTGPEGSPMAGGRGLLVIRPEQLAVAPLSAVEMGAEVVPARLLEASFAGDHTRLRLSIGAGGELIAHRPVGLPLPEIGGDASVAWNLSAARIHAG
ncbi:ABC transporter ATP-binding protein [Roseomonas xinghualingensis]|uniref:ABC transporter ATP-binding protein n=1 Tax=Roseomonas xinghualingensis TaxID=2986475 RepID=UPI0021F0AB9F|nr:ABC transporter ATP-binding protein [Roseomonas sp. SXEYE001]MCV4208292.1 ABC transporter ATP-binding protein [Roseomonas sp. SXEYE001]